MRKQNVLFIRMIAIMFGLAMVISFFNNAYAAFFMFGGAITSFLYSYFDLIKKNGGRKFK